MSEYFRVLRRLERERPDPRAQRALTVAQRSRSQQLAVPAEITDDMPREATPVAELSAEAVAAFATLYDNLRGAANGGLLRNLVFAPASPKESARTVTTGLAAHVERLGLTVLIAELSEWRARPILRVREEQTGKHVGGDPLPLDLHSSTDLSEVTEWLMSSTGDASLVLIEGQPLSESIDSALLARACDGLVIVAETLVTPRAALLTAAERARVAGCRTLGLAMYGSNDRMPAWLRHLTAPPSPSCTLPRTI